MGWNQLCRLCPGKRKGCLWMLPLALSYLAAPGVNIQNYHLEGKTHDAWFLRTFCCVTLVNGLALGLGWSCCGQAWEVCLITQGCGSGQEQQKHLFAKSSGWWTGSCLGGTTLRLHSTGSPSASRIKRECVLCQGNVSGFALDTTRRWTKRVTVVHWNFSIPGKPVGILSLGQDFRTYLHTRLACLLWRCCRTARETFLSPIE